MFSYRRLVAIVLEDFGVRRPRSATGDAVPAITPDLRTPAIELPPSVVWHGTAARGPELQRFCDHLDRLRQGVS